MNAFAPRWLQVVEQIACCLEQFGNRETAELIRWDCIQVRFRLATADTCTYALGDGRLLVVVLHAGNAVERFFLTRSADANRRWSIASADGRLRSASQFGSVAEAREHCVQLTV